MRQSGHWIGSGPLSGGVFKQPSAEASDSLDVAQARRGVQPFLRTPASLDVWSKECLRDVAGRVALV